MRIKLLILIFDFTSLERSFTVKKSLLRGVKGDWNSGSPLVSMRVRKLTQVNSVLKKLKA